MAVREVIFRGKRKDNGEWVYGVPLKEGYSQEVEMLWYEYGSLAYTESVQVIPQTVGQYTGLTDKNGKKIFEGDILAFSDRLVYVHWHDYCGCWDCSYIKAIEGKPTLHEDRSPNKWRYNAEVIGNIHDNKELLEVK